jgi:hypothetical protein
MINVALMAGVNERALVRGDGELNDLAGTFSLFCIESRL